METSLKPARGRPRSFDRDGAVEAAMQLFWRHGYEGVSVGMLCEAFGIAPPSLYAAFGSKAGLYREALDRYARISGGMVLAETGQLSAAVETMLRGAVRAVTAPGRERGCMISGGLVECSHEHHALADELASRRRARRDKMARWLEHWLPSARALALAGTLNVLLQGLSVTARDGASVEDLDAIVDEVVAGLGK